MLRVPPDMVPGGGLDIPDIASVAYTATTRYTCSIDTAGSNVLCSTREE